MKIKKIIPSIIAFLYVTSFYLNCKKQELTVIKDINVEFTIKTQEKNETFHLIIDKPKSVLDIMDQLKSENKINFETKDYNHLAFVVSINNIKNQGNGKDKKNWIYSVNGKLVPMSANQYIIKENSKIQWCFLVWEDRKQCGEEIQNLNHKL